MFACHDCALRRAQDVSRATYEQKCWPRRALLGCNGRPSTSGATSDASETTTTPQLRNLQRGAVRHLGAVRPPPARAQIATVSTASLPTSPCAQWRRHPAQPLDARTTSPGLQARRHRQRRPTQPPGSLAVGRPVAATSIGSTPTRTARSPAPSSTKRSSSATGPTRIAASAACARQAGAAGSTESESHEHPFRRPQRRSRLPGDRVRRRADAAALLHRLPASRPPGRARQPAASAARWTVAQIREAFDIADTDSNGELTPRGSAAPGDPAAQLRGDGPEQGRRTVAC